MATATQITLIICVTIIAVVHMACKAEKEGGDKK